MLAPLLTLMALSAASLPPVSAPASPSVSPSRPGSTQSAFPLARGALADGSITTEVTMTTAVGSGFEIDPTIERARLQLELRVRQIELHQ